VGVHTVVLRGPEGALGSGAPPGAWDECGVLVRPLLNLSERQSRGRRDTGVIRIRALRTLLTMMGHGVGQLRDAGDETGVQLVAVVVI
jgi:hypothetical protein